MIKDFDTFLFESEDTDMKVSDLFASLHRNYETKKIFYTDQSQFSMIEERRDWGDLRQKVKLENPLNQEAYYKLTFTNDEKEYLLEIKFVITYVGKKERDAPETATEAELNRLNVVLDDLKINKISIQSNFLDYNTSNPSDSVKKTCEKFLTKMLSTDYDTLGEHLFSFEQ